MHIKELMLSAVVFAGMTGTSIAATLSFTNVGSGTFIVPDGVSEIDYLIVGGGGGGANGHQGGGGAGEVLVGTLSVVAGQSIAYSIGAGGTGAASQPNNSIAGLTGGASSSFGGITATGGGVVTGVNQGGHNGSSGGGAACNAGAIGGMGGSGGANGQACQSGSSMPIGIGQGSYTSLFALFSEDLISAGEGGAGGTGTHAGGGGAGGVLVNGIGPTAGSGLAAFSALGGSGYGAGGGAGGLDFRQDRIRYGGGAGASGLVYLQFDASVAPIPVPASGLLMMAAVGGLGLLRRHQRKA